MISPKLPESAPQWQNIQWNFWINHDFKSAFGVADLRQFPTTSKTPSLNPLSSNPKRCWSETLRHLCIAGNGKFIGIVQVYVRVFWHVLYTYFSIKNLWGVLFARQKKGFAIFMRHHRPLTGSPRRRWSVNQYRKIKIWQSKCDADRHIG